jgi:hypothetical protein
MTKKKRYKRYSPEFKREWEMMLFQARVKVETRS